MIYKLRDYQEAAVGEILRQFDQNSKPFVIQAATGAGKSLIIADLVSKLDGHALILQPGREILQQNYDKLASYIGEEELGIFSASLERREIKKYTFATIQSIYKQPENFTHFDVLIVDEAHLVNDKKDDAMLTSFIKATKISKIVGLTASPYRLENKTIRTEYGQFRSESYLRIIIGKDRLFKSMPYLVETAELVERGFLARINYRNEPVPWTELVPSASGFTKKSIASFERKNKITDKAIRQILQSDLIGHKTITFAATLDHAEIILAATENKVDIALVSSKTSASDRTQIIRDYKEGRLQHILNYGTLTVGFDSPDITAVILARPTGSPALYYQMIGRGIRQSLDGNKLLQVYDLCGNFDKYGRVEDIQMEQDDEGYWHLFVKGRDRRRKVDGQLLKTQVFQTKNVSLASAAQVRYLHFLASKVGVAEASLDKPFAEMSIKDASVLIDRWIKQSSK